MHMQDSMPLLATYHSTGLPAVMFKANNAGSVQQLSVKDSERFLVMDLQGQKVA